MQQELPRQLSIQPLQHIKSIKLTSKILKY